MHLREGGALGDGEGVRVLRVVRDAALRARMDRPLAQLLHFQFRSWQQRGEHARWPRGDGVVAEGAFKQAHRSVLIVLALVCASELR